MRLRDTRAVIIYLMLGAFAAAADEQVESPLTIVKSPNRAYTAFWVDLPTTAGVQARRIIILIDEVSSKVFSVHATLQRQTGAVWNPQSTACAFFDAPDNANVFVWVVRKDADNQWSETQLDVENVVAELEPAAFSRATAKVGIERLEWSSEDTLNAHLVVNGRPTEIKLPTRSGRTKAPTPHY